ncbi:hypothetical protein PMAYCL1PPCAC_33408 [Pristionchus mayeri]|uniref:Uncharacterized protein n=1 Tax=Pristionchus mayeri TaxID=1317129 RepID=A0AAN5DGH6_9BILA|nr:hypothetical protein PMAYCL1PPCAC_33408 [Pristionchus mayeri]
MATFSRLRTTTALMMMQNANVRDQLHQLSSLLEEHLRPFRIDASEMFKQRLMDDVERIQEAAAMQAKKDAPQPATPPNSPVAETTNLFPITRVSASESDQDGSSRTLSKTSYCAPLTTPTAISVLPAEKPENSSSKENQIVIGSPVAPSAEMLSNAPGETNIAPLRWPRRLQSTLRRGQTNLAADGWPNPLSIRLRRDGVDVGNGIALSKIPLRRPTSSACTRCGRRSRSRDG